MSERKVLAVLLDRLDSLAPMGYNVGLHIRFATPMIYKSSYPEAWVEYYNAHSYYLRDPLVFWGVGVEGTTRWSAIPLPDPFGVMKKAAAHGLNYGAVSSYGPITSRSIVGVSRSDREFSDAELAELKEITIRLHIEAKPSSDLTRAQIEALQYVANGDRNSSAAVRLGITESAFKARLNSARYKREARSTTDADKKARDYRPL
ncbi:autoinducer binding domain-containing protein [Xinfangfangia sp. CPCC 101601]|uniref:Autoinducer binding domain-containing protein n=1 Tax=Pseudogemmobacter lacusdianii TaxID=3069608 RepID=A0ABU0W244_9RHOB|nr:autoinducer binding domain-containing protein [Xinfangfangia sp. CPCC 101601]MDQ2067495.1 autoinducer binding domain-containing protein [Xinfangfangia sp. CPCC 101601]